MEEPIQTIESINPLLCILYRDKRKENKQNRSYIAGLRPKEHRGNI